MFTSSPRNNGFRMDFANGWAISVQWSPGNYCDNNSVFLDDNTTNTPSTTAEVAFIAPDGGLDYNPEWGDQVKGYCTPEKVAQYMIECSQRTETKSQGWPTIEGMDEVTL